MTDFCEEMTSQTERFDTLFSKMSRFMSITIAATVTGGSAPMYDRLSFDEINAFFSDEQEDWNDTAEDDLYVIGKQ